jgi:hypothetical protein
MKITKPASAALIAALVLIACEPPPPKAKAPPAFRPVASIQEIMAAIVDPAADALWESVSTETSAKGIEEHQPRSEAEWLAVRRHALHLIEAGNLLAIEGRPVTHGNKPTEDAHVAGVSAPLAISKAIDADRSAFVAHAHALQDAAGEALVAIDARDAGRLLTAGGKLDQACEKCHVAYWYPGAEKPNADPWPAKVK